MTAFQAQYRLRMKKPRSLNDATETQVLAVGATLFQVSTVQGLTGYEPIMDEPRGRRGRIDALEKSADTGSLSIVLLDRRLGAGNAARFVTQFLGNSSGENQLLGNLVEIDESLDCDPTNVAAATWTRFFTGRCEESKKFSDLELVLTVRDLSEELGGDIFVGRPHSSITYYAEPRLWPLGIRGNWGPLREGQKILGTVDDASEGTGKSVTLSGAGVESAANRVTQALAAYGIQMDFQLQVSRIRAVTTSIRARLVRQDTLAVSEFLITAIRYQGGLEEFLTWKTRGVRIKEILLTPLTVGEEGYGALPPDGTSVEISIVPALARPSSSAPILVNDVHPVQLVKDILDGKWTHRAAAGTVKRTWKYNATNLNALIADPSFGTMRFAIDEVEQLRDFLEEQICQVAPLAYRLNPSGELELVDMRTPAGSSPTAVTITDDDLYADAPEEWQQGRSGAVTRMAVAYQYDLALSAEALEAVEISEGLASVPRVALFESFEREVIKPDFGRFDLGDKSFEIDARGLRVANGESQGNQDAEDAMVGRVEELMNHYRAPFGSGPLEVTLPCRRTANTGAQPGDWRLVTVTTLPDPASNQRGGTRLMRCIERSEDGLGVNLRFLDAGPNVIKVAPSIGVLTTLFVNAIGVPVTLNAANDWVQLEAAVTDTSVTLLVNVPASAWRVRQTVAATGTVTLTGFASGKRVWIRAKSIVGFAKAPGIPSSYVSPATPYRDIAAISAPSGLAVSAVSSLAATLTWTNGSTSRPLKLRLVTPSSGTPTVIIAILPVGTTSYVIHGTENGATYKARLSHADGSAGGESGYVEVSWTASGVAPTAPAVLGIGFGRGAVV